MTRPLPLLGSLAETIEKTDSLDALGALLIKIQNALGLDHHFFQFALQGEVPVRITDLQAGHSFDHDLVHLESARRVRPFFWCPATSCVSRYRENSTVFVVPMHIQGFASGFLAWFCGREGFDTIQLSGGQFLAACLFDHLFKLNTDTHKTRPRLSRRQIECLQLSAKGKSNWVIADILGLKPDTVHKYLEQAKARYGVSTRTQLVVRALYNGDLFFHDLL